MISIVVPSIRPEHLEEFKEAWRPLIDAHNASLITVIDGENPFVVEDGVEFSADEIMGEYKDLIYNFNDGVRNLGFAYVAKYRPESEYIFSFDDDCFPVADTLSDHIDALNMRVPVSWLSTASNYMRGYPYGVRSEAEVVLSHGVWDGIKDYDAATQLVNGNKDCSFYKGPIPKGIYYPHCAMNFAFKRKLLPYIYQAPMGPKVGLDRFADIWTGITCKREIDKKGWAVVTGYSTIYHKRASNVFTNLKKEAKGIELNERFWQGDESDPYFKLFEEKRNRWIEFIKQYENVES